MNMPIREPLRDPLLLAGKAITLVAQGAMAIGAAALVIATPAVLILRNKVITEYAASVGDPSATFPVFTVAGVLLVGLAIVAALFVFFGKLRAIIDTVGGGDPFVPANADRLSLMAWLLLLVQVLAIPVAALGNYLAQFADEVENAHVDVDIGLDLTGLLMVVLLFILARVFRKGTEMREDLEGTI